MPAECSPPAMQFARLDGRAVVADFGGGVMTSDAGALLLGATDRAIGLVDRFAACFSDGRGPLVWCTTSPPWWASGCSALRWATRS